MNRKYSVQQAAGWPNPPSGCCFWPDRIRRFAARIRPAPERMRLPLYGVWHQLGGPSAGRNRSGTLAAPQSRLFGRAELHAAGWAGLSGFCCPGSFRCGIMNRENRASVSLRRLQRRFCLTVRFSRKAQDRLCGRLRRTRKPAAKGGILQQ